MFSLHRLLGMATMRSVVRRVFRRGGIGSAASGLAHNRFRAQAHKQLACNLRRII